MSAIGPLADIASCAAHVRFLRQSGHCLSRSLSALRFLLTVNINNGGFDAPEYRPAKAKSVHDAGKRTAQ